MKNKFKQDDIVCFVPGAVLASETARHEHREWTIIEKGNVYLRVKCETRSCPYYEREDRDPDLVFHVYDYLDIQLFLPTMKEWIDLL